MPAMIKMNIKIHPTTAAIIIPITAPVDKPPEVPGGDVVSTEVVDGGGVAVSTEVTMKPATL